MEDARWQPRSSERAISRGVGTALVLAGLAGVTALGSVTLLRRVASALEGSTLPWAYELVVHLGALLLPVTVLPLLHAVRAAMRTERMRHGVPLRAGEAGIGAGELEVPWSDVQSIDREPDALVLTLTPKSARATTIAIPARFDTPVDQIEQQLTALRTTPPDDRGGRALDHEIFTAACAGQLLPPGCFVVRRRRAASVGLLVTPRALLAREGDAYRRVPWRWIASADLGSTDPHEYAASDLLIARDASGRSLAQITCRDLALPADALLALVREHIT
jgi:hypothetical protein